MKCRKLFAIFAKRHCRKLVANSSFDHLLAILAQIAFAKRLNKPSIEFLLQLRQFVLGRELTRIVAGCALFMVDAGATDLRAIRGRICAIGPATRDALQQLHLKVDLMAEEYVAEGLLEKLADYQLTGSHVLIARAAVARDLLPVELAKRGAHVDVVEAYCTAAPDNLATAAADAWARRPHWITFTSSSTVKNLVAAAGPLPTGARTVSIGPITSATLRSCGLPVDVEASVYTVGGLVDGLLLASIIKT